MVINRPQTHLYDFNHNSFYFEISNWTPNSEHMILRFNLSIFFSSQFAESIECPEQQLIECHVWATNSIETIASKVEMTTTKKWTAFLQFQ